MTVEELIEKLTEIVRQHPEMKDANIRLTHNQSCDLMRIHKETNGVYRVELS